MLALKIVGALLALGVGIYLGAAGRYTPDPEDLDRALGPGGKTRKVRRSFTPLGWLRQTAERGSHSRRRRGTGRFSMVAPEKPKERRDEG